MKVKEVVTVTQAADIVGEEGAFWIGTATGFAFVAFGFLVASLIMWKVYGKRLKVRFSRFTRYSMRGPAKGEVDADGNPIALQDPFAVPTDQGVVDPLEPGVKDGGKGDG